MRGDKAPLTYTQGKWPHDAVPLPSAPPGVHYALALARALVAAAQRQGLSQRASSLRAGLNPTLVGRIVRGEVYPDLATIARLEVALQEPLLSADRLLTVPPAKPGPEGV